MPGDRRTILLLNLFWIAIYFCVFFSLNIDISRKIMFSTPDSREYFSVSGEFYNFSESGRSITRPFLYPLIVMLSWKPFGVFGIWLVQFGFWLASVNLLFLSLKRITGKTALGIVASLIVVLNFSYIAATLHGLTEVTTIFLLSLLLYKACKGIDSIQEIRVFHGLLFLLVLLTLVKPLFFLPLLFVLFIILPVFYLKAYIRTPKSLLVLGLICVPLLYQLTLMKVKYDMFTVSEISSKTFRKYLVAQGMQENNKKRDWIELQHEAEVMSTGEIFSYMSANKGLYWYLYRENLRTNIDSKADFLLYPEAYSHQKLGKFMGKVNTIYYHVHWLFIFPVLLSIFIAFRRKETGNLLILLIASGLSYYILLTSGISFWQGDRLTLPALTVFVFLYFFAGHYLYTKIRRGRTAKA